MANSILKVAASKFYLTDGSPSDVNALLGTTVLPNSSVGAPSSITVRGSGSINLPSLISQAMPGGRAAGYPIDTVTFGDIWDSVAVTNKGLNVTKLNLGTTGKLTLPSVKLLTGASSDLELNVKASNHPQSIMQIEIDSTTPNTTATIDLDTNILTAYTPPSNIGVGGAGAGAGGGGGGAQQGGGSLIVLKGDIAVKTKFDRQNDGSVKYGKIVVDGAGSAINIDSSSNLNITLDANNEAYVSPVEIKVLENTLNAQIQVGVGSLSELIVVQNMNLLRPTIWTYDPSSYTIKGAQGAAPAMPVGTSQNALNLANVLINSPANPTVIRVTRQLGSAPTLEGVVEGIEAMVISSGAEQSNAEALSIRNMAIQERLMLIGDHLGNSSKFTEGDGGVSAGGSYEKIRGVWASGFVQKVKQKAYSDTQGYKMLSRGSNLGADTTISDNSLIGMSWTNAHSIMKHKNNRIEGKAKVATNIFSLYSFTGLPGDWFLQGDISYGSSSTRKRATRFDNTLINPTQAKYKSHFYGADMQLIKQITRGNFLLQPTSGLSYNHFKDDAYQEYGGVQNWTTKARVSYNIEALVGGRAMYSLDFKNDWVLRPYVSAYSHIMVKDKKGKIHSSIDGLLNVSFELLKQAPHGTAWGQGYMHIKAMDLKLPEPGSYSGIKNILATLAQ